MIHPFLDGNGRLGRLLLTFFLVARARLTAPLLYLSAYPERNLDSYYEALRTIDETDDRTPWIESFDSPPHPGRRVRRGCMRNRQAARGFREAEVAVATPRALALVEVLSENPPVTARSIEDRLDVSPPTALGLLRRMWEQGVLSEGKDGARGKRRYVALKTMDAGMGSPGG